jgi:phosphate-selective porin OprO/OprP
VRRWTASVTGSSLLLILLVSGARASLGDGAVETTATAAEPDPAGESPAAVEISAGPGGFVLRSSGGDFTLRLRSLVQMDGRFYTGDGPSSDGFLVRRARLELVGTLFGRFDFRLMPDFAGSATTLLDAWVRWKMSPAFQVQVGKVKLPVGLERAQSREFNSCNEFGYPTSLVPNRDIGANIQGELVDGSLAYYLGVFDGTGDGGSASADTDGDRELAARLFAIPFKGDGESWLENLGFGVAGTWGRRQAAPTAYRTVGQQTFFRWSDGVVTDGTTWRVVPQLYYYRGPFGLLSEYAVSSQEVRNGEQTSVIENLAWTVNASWVLTGEDASFGAVIPARAIDRQAGGFGAWELVVRMSVLELDAAVFPVFADSSNSAESARTTTAVVNWYLNPMFRVSVDYSHTDLEGGPLASEDVIIARMQLRF